MKKYLSLVISYVPLNILRIILFNYLLGYKISFSSKIGLGTRINVRKATINNARIGRSNKFVGGFLLEIEEGTKIGNSNEFVCTAGTAGKAYCKFGKEVDITHHHFFDASGGLEIKDMTRIAGRGSQIWTHGGQRSKTAVVIHEKCYVGSAVRISQGVEIAENSFVGLGSVVVDSFDQPNVLIFGSPAKIVKTEINARLSLVEEV